jgi:hypothetical protein
MNRTRLPGALAASTALLVASGSLGNHDFELAPGRIHNPAGNQQFQRIVYNPVLDNYFLLYAAGSAGTQAAMVGHLSVDATGPSDFTNPTALSGNIGVTHVNGAFNPDDGTFLIVYRTGAGAEIFGQYLSSNGTPIGSAFSIGVGGTGFGPSIAYSPTSERYVVTWEQLGSGTVRYRVIDGDSTSASPTITPSASISFGLTDGIAYGSVADKFLAIYVRDTGGTAKGNIYGRFISSDGLSVGPEFPIATGIYDQGYARVAYAPSTNRWMVSYENWANCGGGCPHNRGALIDPNGAVVKGFSISSTSAWDQPGPVTYNPVTDTFVTGWRAAYSDSNIQVRAGEFSPLDGSLVRPVTLLTDLDAGVEGVAARPDDSSPQAAFIFRVGVAGGDGLHVGIVNLPAPPPDVTPPEAVTDLSAVPTAGGNPVPATAIASTSPGPSTTDMFKTTDGDPATYWQAPNRSTMTTEFITWDLGATKTLSQVSLLARSTGNLFPVDYQIQVSDDNASFATVFSQTGAAPALGTWVDHELPDPSGRYVRLWITKTKLTAAGKYSAQLAEVEIREATAGETLDVQWTAPGDDGDVGTATSYDLRWSTNPIDNGNFPSATAIPTPLPSRAGTAESLLVSGFPSEDIVYLALKSTDNEGFTSGLSNVAQVTTPGVPPAPVSGFLISSPTGTSVNLAWQPSGDDGNTGNATSYDIRYSTSPITSDAVFDAAASVLRPATNPKPAQETYTLGGLSNQTTYFFAIKALDDVGYASALTGGPSFTATTLDVLDPSAIGDLDVEPAAPALVKVNAPAIAASGENSATEGRAKATDGNLSSYWATPGRAVMQNEWITVDTGALRSIGRVRLRSRSAGALFPEDLAIQISNDNATWSTVVALTGLPATVGIWHDIDFAPFNGRYVRVFITKTRLSGGGLFVAQIAEIEVYQTVVSHQMTASWTEPGDDGGSGTAMSFDLRYSTSSIDNDSEFDAATPIVGEPVPGGAGSLASFSFESPQEGVTLFFRMKAFDDSGNASPLSNSESATTTSIPPAAVSDLLAFNPTSSGVELSWTATGDDAVTGTAAAYDVRYSTSLITAGNFASATPATGEPAPGAPGALQGMTVSGLNPSTTYYFAMTVLDEAANVSDLSNVVSAATDAPDTTDPGNVTDLRGSAPFTVDLLPAPAIAASSVESGSAGFDKATDGISTSYWGSLANAAQTVEWITLDTGSLHDIGEVRISSRPAGSVFPEDLQIQVSSDNASFTTVKTATGLPATQGMTHTFSFPAASGRYVRIYITKSRKNGANLFAAQIAEVQVFEANFFFGPLTLNWTAPGDDGPNGRAASYDVRFSTTPITSLATFNAATPASGEPTPQTAGSTETFALNLPSGMYYLALRAQDEAGNQSGVSNVPVIVIP